MTKLLTRTHRLISRGVMLPLSRAQRLARPSRRKVIRAYYQGMAFRRQSNDWSCETKREWVIERLRFVVRRAYNETNYYRELFDHIGFDPSADFSFEDFCKIPVLERSDVSNKARELLSQILPQTDMLRDSTGGSTGAPTHVWLGP